MIALTILALLAPTELLANQHFRDITASLEQSFEADGLRPVVRLCTSALRVGERDELMSELDRGVVDVIIGTHAILQQPIISRLANLGLVVIDEEQRFGVNQRQLIARDTNVLYTTATPIPRSLSKTVTAQMQLSTLGGLRTLTCLFMYLCILD